MQWMFDFLYDYVIYHISNKVQSTVIVPFLSFYCHILHTVAIGWGPVYQITVLLLSNASNLTCTSTVLDLSPESTKPPKNIALPVKLADLTVTAVVILL